jgi:aminopeptidase N
VLVRTLADGLRSDELLLQINEALAHSWFREQIYPAANAAIGLGQGLPNYATIVMAEASGGESARRNRVIEFLRAYQDAVKQAAGTPNAEKAIISTMPYDPIDQRRMARSKATLFFIALEDTYGEEPVRRGLTEVVALLRGQQVGYEDVRSALEHSTGKDLGEPFRVWLYTVGIPKDFSDRYAFAATNGG